MNSHTLELENEVFAGTRGISENNRNLGFLPAFLDKTTGRIELARLECGDPAMIHIIQWLPTEWAAEMREDGSVQQLKPQIISGFVSEGIFYTREEVAEL
jgi:hypothetical protein